MLKKAKEWIRRKLTSSVTSDDIITAFKKERVREVILEPACYWRPSIRHLFRHKCVIDYVGVRRGTKKPLRRQEVLLSIPGRSTNKILRKKLVDLSPIVYERTDEVLEKIPGVRAGIANEYLKTLGGNLYILPIKKVREHNA
ncbi:hypothetical protein HY839_03190 [Candidatus Azambacteria bacterium]|nr:hypothetical protein [Candidatus Azambacteria bacterium]